MARGLPNGINLYGQRAQNAGDASADTDLATWGQVKNVVAGLDPKPSVRVVATGNLALTGTQTVDGVALAAGERVLLTAQTTASQNGIWVVAAGAWTRPTDVAQGNLSSGAITGVESGSANADTLWWLTTDGAVTVGTTAQTWSKVAFGITYTAGSGITIVGNAIAVVANTAHTFSTTIGDGATTSIAVAHGLGTRDVVTRVYRTDTFAEEDPDVIHTDANTVTVTFGTAPAAGAYRVVVTG